MKIRMLTLSILGLLVIALSGCAVIVPRPGHTYYHDGWGSDHYGHVVIINR